MKYVQKSKVCCTTNCKVKISIQLRKTLLKQKCTKHHSYLPSLKSFVSHVGVKKSHYKVTLKHHYSNYAAFVSIYN